MARAWLTPDSTAADGAVHCRRLLIPTEYLPHVSGALWLLTRSFRWEADGDITPEDAALAMAALVEDYYASEGCLIGTLIDYITEAAPDGTLPLDGGTYNDADYPDLAAALASIYDNADGTFTLPNLNGYSRVGSGTGGSGTSRSLGDAYGTETVTLTAAQMPAHTHTEEGTIPAASNVLGELPGIQGAPAQQPTGSAGSDQPHDNQGPRYAVKMAVFYR